MSIGADENLCKDRNFLPDFFSKNEQRQETTVRFCQRQPAGQTDII